MAGKPKKSAVKKQKLSLTVSAQTRLELSFISDRTRKSVSALISSWAKKEVKAICKRTGEELPNIDQMTIDDLEGE